MRSQLKHISGRSLCLREWRKHKGVNQEELAEMVRNCGYPNFDRSMISKYESGKHLPDVTRLSYIAKALGIKTDDLFLPPSQVKNAEKKPIIYIRISKCVAAGSWRSVDDPDAADFEPYDVPVILPNGIKTAFGVKIRGDSMNEEYPDGTDLICLPIYEWGGVLQPGQHVIVERHDNGSVEYTCKELWRDDEGVLWLRPRSNNPKHQLIRADQETDGIEVRITAIVWRVNKPGPGL